jgi:protein-S-isoprenylcysteine O-methyltransferase Ste14
MTVLRHLLAVLLLPFTVTVLVPWWLLTASAGGGARLDLLGLAGAAVFALGFALFAWCVSLFARVGEGTLAPWDPTQKIVAVGPYRHVRNPMITGVATMLLGEALFFGSVAIGVWLLTFVTINHVYFISSEEPGLEQRFGESYRVYKANVPRWLPRVTAWTQSQ